MYYVFFPKLWIYYPNILPSFVFNSILQCEISYFNHIDHHQWRSVCKAHLGTCLGEKNWEALFEAPRGTAKSEFDNFNHTFIKYLTTCEKLKLYTQSSYTTKIALYDRSYYCTGPYLPLGPGGPGPPPIGLAPPPNFWGIKK